MSRSASAAPRSPATVEKRANIGVCLPISEKIFAFVKRVMSCVTVKVPWAPQPLACIRRSGITSRSKCASFSMSQMSCSSAGPRGPAVKMLVLSATGAPASLVKTFFVDIRNSLIVWARMCLAGPGRGADHAAEILGPEGGILVGEHVGVDSAKGRLGLAVEAVVKGLDDLFLEASGARVRADHRFALGVRELGKSDAEHVHLDAGGNERDDGMHVLWDAGCGVQRDRGPDRLDLALCYAVAAQEVTGTIGAVDLETLMRACMLGGEAHVMEHSAGVKELGIEAKPAALSSERAPVIDAARVMEEQRRLGIPDQLGHFPCQFAVRNDNTRYRAGRRIACGRGDYRHN